MGKGVAALVVLFPFSAILPRHCIDRDIVARPEHRQSAGVIGVIAVTEIHFFVAVIAVTEINFGPSL
jgi:hypothetical protein